MSKSDSVPFSQRYSRETLGLALLLFLVALSRILTAERYISGLDPGNYMLGMKEYSIAAERPHPPGYPVYMALCNAASALVGDDHTGILVVLMICSVAAVWLLYVLAREWMGERSALLAAALLAVNPVFWLYGSITENYVYDAFAGTGLVLLTLRTRGSWWIASGMGLGLALGMRGTSLLLMGPALASILLRRFRLRDLTVRDAGRCALGVMVGIACWLPYVVVNEGGIGAYLHAASNLTTNSAGTFIGNIAGFSITVGWTLNILAAYLLIRLPRLWRRLRERGPVAVTLALWIIPPALFFALIIYAKGYIMLILPALCIVAARLIRGERSMAVGRSLAALAMTIDLGIFLLAPYVAPPAFTTLAPRNRTVEQRASSVVGRALSVFMPSLARIRRNDSQVESTVTMIRDLVGSGSDTTLIVLDPASLQFVNARVLQVYLPSFRFVEPGIRNDRMITYFQGIDKSERFGDAAGFDRPRLLLVTHAGLADRYAGVGGREVHRDDYVTVIEVPGDHRGALRLRIEELFTRWDMQGDPRARNGTTGDR